MSVDTFRRRVGLLMATLGLETATASRVQATYITPDTSFLAARASEKALVFTSRAIAESARYLGQELDPDTARQLMLLRFGAAMPAPDDPDKRRTRRNLDGDGGDVRFGEILPRERRMHRRN